MLNGGRNDKDDKSFWKKFLCILLIILLVFTFALNSHALSRVNIGFVLDGPSILNDRVLDSYKREITAVTEGEFEVKFQQNNNRRYDSVQRKTIYK